MKKIVRLGVNTGFALNRFPEPHAWAEIVGDFLNLRSVQFTADLLNPALPKSFIDRQVKDIRSACRKYDISIEHTFTSAFTRLNHLTSPNKELREYWINWFKKFVDISVALGAKSMGSHFGILSVADCKDKNKCDFMTSEGIRGWHEIAKYGKKQGLEYLTWEPMSVGREFGETIQKAGNLHKRLNSGSSLPVKLCLDVDHGDVSSGSLDDIDPYKWLEVFAKESPIIHIKQSLLTKHGHHPFTEEYNKKGKIVPGKILKHLDKYGGSDTLLLLELSFREREPYESKILDDLKESVEYWRPHVSV